MQIEAMGRPRRRCSARAADASGAAEDAAQAPELWLDADPGAYRPAAPQGDKGADKRAGDRRPATKRPDPSSDRANNGEFGTAYRIRTGDLRLERAVS